MRESKLTLESTEAQCHLWVCLRRLETHKYLNGKTREKIWIKFGLEFRPKIAWRCGIIVKRLNGLQTSSTRLAKHLVDTIRSMGWFECKAENDFWMKNCKTHDEYLAIYFKDIVVVSRDLKGILDELKKSYVLQGVGTRNYFLRGEYGHFKGK